MLIKPPYDIISIKEIEFGLYYYGTFTRDIEDFVYFNINSLGDMNFRLKANANIQRYEDIVMISPFEDIIKFKNIGNVRVLFNNDTTRFIMIPYFNMKEGGCDNYGEPEYKMNLDMVTYLDNGDLVVSVNHYT